MKQLWFNKQKRFFDIADFPEVFYEILQKGNNNHLCILSIRDNTPQNTELLKTIFRNALKKEFQNTSLFLWKQQSIPAKFLNSLPEKYIFLFGNPLAPYLKNYNETENNKKMFVLPSLNAMQKNVKYKKFTWNLLKKYYLTP